MLRTRPSRAATAACSYRQQDFFSSASSIENMAENIVHLVLARLRMHRGTKGTRSSAFPIRSRRHGPYGANRQRNGIYCGGIEHKMGSTATRSCQIVLDARPVGWSAREQGPQCEMFVIDERRTPWRRRASW